MKCKKCMYCVQVSANEYKVRCNNKKIAESSNYWITEPSYCAYYTKGKHSLLDDYQIGCLVARLADGTGIYRKI